MPTNPQAKRWPRALLGSCLALTLAIGAPVGAPSYAAPSEAELDAAEARLYELERDFQLVSERYNLVAERFTRIQAEIAAAELEVREVERRITTRTDAAVALARELYKSGSTGALESVLSAKSIAEVEMRLTYLRSSEEAQVQVFERLSVDQRDLEEKIAALERAQNRAARAKVELNTLREDLELRVIEQEDEVTQLNAALEAARRREAAREAARQAAAATATVGSVPIGVAAKASNPRAQEAVDAAMSQTGKPYQWGGSGPNGYDCSGLTMWSWSQAGVALPHNSGSQYAATKRVDQSDWEPGDLLFFGSPIHHVGMYIGNGQIVEAPYSGQVVRVNSAYRSDYAGAGRPGV